jgi:signal peptide peptidase SppA
MPTKKSPTGCRPDQLRGLWAIEPSDLEKLASAAERIDLNELARMNAEADACEAAEPPKDPYVLDSGVAVIQMSGPTTKYPTSFSRMLGGTSTMMTEKALRQAVADPGVRSIVMHLDSVPGGTVAGAFELYDAIRKADAVKPVYGHADDQATSAGQLFLAACRRCTANRTAVLGSIGVRTELVDSSEKASRDGIKVIPIASGKFKAAGSPGTKITDEQVQEIQTRIDAMNDQFVADVAKGRKLDPQAIRDMEARIYVGEQAREKGLIDAVCSLGEALAYAQSQQQTSPPTVARGPVGVGRIAAAPSERSPRMDLLTQLREVLGAADMTEDQAVGRVRALATENATFKAAVPKDPDPDLLRELAEVRTDRIANFVERRDLTPAIATKLNGLLMKDGKPNPFMLVKADAIGGRPIDLILGLFEGAKLAPPTGSQTPSQIDRETPGVNAGTEDAAKIAKAGEDQGKAYAEKQMRARGVNAA